MNENTNFTVMNRSEIRTYIAEAIQAKYLNDDILDKIVYFVEDLDDCDTDTFWYTVENVIN